MNVSRETMTVEKYPHEIVKYDILCLGDREILVLDIDPTDAIVTYHDGRQPTRVMLSPYSTYTTITEVTHD